MEQFRRALIEVINSSELPFDARYYIVKDVYRDVFELYEKMLEEQDAAIAYQKEEAERRIAEEKAVEQAMQEEIANKNIVEHVGPVEIIEEVE
ncbi:MAG: hypothetical protein IJZ77_02760 [Bacilli bacterium]|nr:hypothetical protein [Bacilli bacterium]